MATLRRSRPELVVLDVKGNVLHRERFWTRRAAHRQGRAITRPPLNRYEVR